MRLLPVVRAAGSKLAPWVTTRGHFEYELQHSRDSRYPVNPNFKFDTYSRFFGNAWKGKMEIYPILVFTAFACGICAYTIYWSFGKQEVWLNRSHHDPPWDWGRLRTHYWLNNARFHFVDAADKEFVQQRKPIMETLNDEMLEEAIKRGTRNPDGSTKIKGHH